MTLASQNTLSKKLNHLAAWIHLGSTKNKIGSRSCSRSIRRQHGLESTYASLETRKMLASATVIDGTLQVLGDNNAEILSVRQVNSDLVVYSSVGDSPGQNIFTTAAQGIDEIVMRGFGGNDQLVNRTDIASLIQGGGGDDVIIGGTGNDILQGADGNDRIIGDFCPSGGKISMVDFGGDDQIAGGAGDDVIEGVGGHDRINGQAGEDVLRGGFGDDIVSGSDGNDFVFGDDGNDVLSGGQGNDQVFGDDGNDVLLGDQGNDALFGGEGDDRLRGSDGIDFLVAGAGDDVLFSNGGARSRDILNGGHGDDVYRFDGDGQVALNQIVVNGVLVHDTIIETLSSGNDTIEYLGLGVHGDGNVEFNGDSTDAFRYQQRIVGLEVPGAIEIFSDLREPLGSQSMPLDTHLDEVFSEGGVDEL